MVLCLVVCNFVKTLCLVYASSKVSATPDDIRATLAESNSENMNARNIPHWPEHSG